MMTTNADRTPIYSRAEPIFGICEALGDDLGVNPDWFRVALAPLLFLNPIGTIVGYFATGLFLLALRLFMPDVRAPRVAAIEAEPATPEAATAEPSEKLPLAA